MAIPTAASSAPIHHAPWYKHLYVQVLCAIAIGVFLGLVSPSKPEMTPAWIPDWMRIAPGWAEAMKPFGDAFIKCIKMLIAPIIFCTVVHGIASMGDLKKVGRVGIKALIYFELVTTLALVIGLIIVQRLAARRRHEHRPDLARRQDRRHATPPRPRSRRVVGHLMHIIPDTVVGAFAEGEILQVLFLAILFAIALHHLGERGKPLLGLIDQAAHTFFGIVGIVMKVAPIGAFGAMAFTIGKYGIATLLLARQADGRASTRPASSSSSSCSAPSPALAGFNIFKFIRYIKEELLIVLGTSSSESVLPRMIAKMEKLGCEKSVVGLVIPTGYSFNLDGTCIYLTMAALFLAQATNTDLTLAQQLGILGVLLLTSKGAAA